MTDKKLPTISLQGRQYVQVKDRILYFNETYPKGSITTTFKLKEDNSYAWFTATVCPDADSHRMFTAHSGGPIDDEKAIEKLETVAVGRALAFMGIGVIEGIASADEMDKFVKTKENAVKKTAPSQTIKNDNGTFRTGVSPKSGRKWYAKVNEENNNLEFIEYEEFAKLTLQPTPPSF